ILGRARQSAPFCVPWPVAGNPGAILEFATSDEWLAFLSGLDLNTDVPRIVSTKYSRAQRLYALSWLDFDLIKAGELVAITTLEITLKDRYGGLIPKERPMLGDLLRHLVIEDGHGDTNLSFTQRYGGKGI
ncbi:hypothetical protein GR214_35385, partial [Rhizobium leguminosarum]|nr:hypothetical protein [Rhizobium leguminosarum]